MGGSRNLEFVDLNHNSLKELSLDSLIGLRINISSNRITELDISDYVALLEFDNSLSAAQINSHLDALVNFQNYSGSYTASDFEYSDFEQLVDVSGRGFSDAAILGWARVVAIF